MPSSVDSTFLSFLAAESHFEMTCHGVFLKTSASQLLACGVTQDGSHLEFTGHSVFLKTSASQLLACGVTQDGRPDRSPSERHRAIGLPVLEHACSCTAQSVACICDPR